MFVVVFCFALTEKTSQFVNDRTEQKHHFLVNAFMSYAGLYPACIKYFIVNLAYTNIRQLIAFRLNTELSMSHQSCLSGNGKAHKLLYWIQINCMDSLLISELCIVPTLNKCLPWCTHNIITLRRLIVYWKAIWSSPKLSTYVQTILDGQFVRQCSV